MIEQPKEKGSDMAVYSTKEFHENQYLFYHQDGTELYLKKSKPIAEFYSRIPLSDIGGPAKLQKMVSGGDPATRTERPRVPSTPVPLAMMYLLKYFI